MNGVKIQTNRHASLRALPLEMQVCVCKGVGVCAFACMCVCVYMSTCVCARACLPIYVVGNKGGLFRGMRVLSSNCPGVEECLDAHRHEQACITYTCAHTRTHTHTQTEVNKPVIRTHMHTQTDRGEQACNRHTCNTHARTLTHRQR